MPSIMNEKEGRVTNWMKKVGDSFVSGDRLCEITFPIATIGIDAKEDGVLAKIVVTTHETAPADSTVALYAISREYYMNYLAESMEHAVDSEKLAHAVEAVEEATKKPDASVMMKVIKHLIKDGDLDGKSEVGKYIQSMARKGDEELLAAFAASCEGSSYHQETFDEDFFVSNATAIAEEHLKRETK
eukprot:gene16560-18890_t